MANGNSTRRGSRFIDLTGMTFGRWTVIQFHSITKCRATGWLCRCQCGTEAIVTGGNLRQGISTQCMKCARSRHGKAGTPEHHAWQDMRARCFNAAHSEYSNYGNRGITVCQRWLSFENFSTDMGPRPSPAHSLDRIDNDGNYEPGNCRWATRKEQQRNRRANCLLTHNGTTVCMAEWAEVTGIPVYSIRYRLKRGWTLDKALTTPVKSQYDKTQYLEPIHTSCPPK